MPDVMPIPNVEFTVNDRGGEYFAKLQSLAAAVDTAVGAANEIIERDDLLEDYLQLVTDDYKGPWAGLTGELNQPASSDHNGVMWRLEVDLPNVTLSEPSDENEDWSRESARFASGAELDAVEDVAVAAGEAATAAAGVAGTAMQPGDGGWLGNSISIGVSNAAAAPLGSAYHFAGTHVTAVAQGFPDLELDDADVVHWILSTYGTSTRAVQTATQIIDIGGTQGAQRMRVKIDAVWAAWAGADSASSSVTDPIITIPSPTAATEYVTSANFYAHDYNIDLRLGRWFEGYVATSTTYLPVGAAVPLGATNASARFTQKFYFIGLDDLPTDGQYIGFLNWSGFRRQGYASGEGIAEFYAPAGWVLSWAGGVAPTFLTRGYYYAGPASILSRFERIQVTVNHLNKTLMLSYAEMSRRN